MSTDTNTQDFSNGIPMLDTFREFALITPDGIVGNIIVCHDEEWVKSHPDWVDLTIIDVTDMSPRPSVLWTYDAKTKEFTAPPVPAAVTHFPDPNAPAAETIPTFDEVQSIIAQANGTVYAPATAMAPTVDAPNTTATSAVSGGTN